MVEEAGTPTPRGTGPVVLAFDGESIWVANFGTSETPGNTVTKLSLDGAELGTFQVGTQPFALAFDGKSIWVANWLDGTVMKLNLDGAELDTFSVGNRPIALAFDGEGIWVASKNRTLSRLRLSSE